MDYEKDLKIDENALDIEWLEQASLAMRWAKNYAVCRRRLTEAEEKIKIVRAELIKKVNRNPDKYLGEGVKPTAPVVEAYYRLHSKHIEAKEEWVEAQFELNIAEAAKNEISFTRKAALENLVILHGQQYFAGPKMPRNLNDEVQKRKERQEKANKRVSKKMKRTL